VYWMLWREEGPHSLFLFCFIIKYQPPPRLTPSAPRQQSKPPHCPCIFCRICCSFLLSVVGWRRDPSLTLLRLIDRSFSFLCRFIRVRRLVCSLQSSMVSNRSCLCLCL
jgi:hypothetical protein